jgi:uncharacterized membrane protein YfcA
MVPLMVLAVGMTQHRAHATSLAAILPIAAVGAATYAVAGRVDYGIAAALAGGSLLGAPLGASLMARIDEGPLKIAFGVFMVVVAIVLLVAP